MSCRWLCRTAVVLSLLWTAGCPRGPDPATEWREAGFISQAAADTEAFLSLHHPAATATAVAAAWRPVLEDPALRASWERTPAGQITGAILDEATAVTLLDAIAASSGDEIFLVCGAGTAAQLAALQRIKRLFEAARVRNLFTPFPGEGLFAGADEPPEEATPEDLARAAFTDVIIPLPPAMQEALEYFVRDAAVPPLLAGFRSETAKRLLPATLGAWVDSLPENIPRDTWTADDDTTFRRVRLPLSAVIPWEAARRARDLLAAGIGDPETATEIIRGLLAKTTLMHFGEARGYFLVSVGMDNPLDALAGDFADSLAAREELDRLRPLLGTQVAALFYADPLMVSLAASPPPVGEYLDAALESALEFAPADRLRTLRRTAELLRPQAEALFQPRVAAFRGLVMNDDEGWRAELFGGSLAPRLALENATPLLAPTPELSLLWTEHWEKDYAGRLARFAAALSAFSDEWIDALGPVFLDAPTRERTGRLLGWLAAASAPLDGPAAGLLDDAFNNNTALALGLDGIMPSPPFTPPAAAQAILPRLAVAVGLGKTAALGRLHEELLAPHDDAALLWPLPVTTTAADGTTTYAYPLPLAGPDLAPAVTIQRKRWILGTSPSFNTVVAALPSASRRATAVQTIHMATAPMADFAAAWAEALEAEPGMGALTFDLIPREPSTLRALAAVGQRPHHFHYHARWERGVLHRVLTLRPAP